MSASTINLYTDNADACWFRRTRLLNKRLQVTRVGMDLDLADSSCLNVSTASLSLLVWHSVLMRASAVPLKVWKARWETESIVLLAVAAIVWAEIDWPISGSFETLKPNVSSIGLSFLLLPFHFSPFPFSRKNLLTCYLFIWKQQIFNLCYLGEEEKNVTCYWDESKL